MALAAVKTFIPGEVLYASDLNALNTNILNNGLALISPLTGDLNAGSQDITALGSVVFSDAAASPATTGQLQRNGTTLQYYTGTTALTLGTTTDIASAGRDFNYIFNDFELWGSGTTSAPTGWPATGSPTIARNTGGAGPRTGTYFLDMTRAGTDCDVRQDVAVTYPHLSWWVGKTVTFGCYVRTAVANVGRISIADGSSTSSSSYHAGDDVWRWMTVTHTIASGATGVSCLCRIDTTNALVKFDGPTLVIGSTVADFLPPGWRGRKAVMEFFSSHVTSVAAGTTNYLGAVHATAEAQSMMAIPFKCVARNLFAVSNANAGAGQSFVYTFRNGADTAVTCTTTGATTYASSNVANEVAVAKGAESSVKLVTSAGAGAGFHRVTLELEEVP